MSKKKILFEGYELEVDSSGNLVFDGSVISVAALDVGDVKTVSTSTVPTGFLECDGSAISRTTYADLFAVIGTTYGVGDGSTTFNIPDLRGEFVRGWDNGRGVDTGRSIATAQTDAFQGHWHNLRGESGANGGGGRVDVQGIGTNAGNDHVQAPVTDGSSGTPRTASETRPTNVAMMYCIKY